MKFSKNKITEFENTGAEFFVPDGTSVEDALARTNGGSVAIGAHHDDLEIFAMHGIGKAYGRRDKMFTGVTVTDSSGSPRKGAFENFTNAAMMDTRHEEQKKAAIKGKYASQFLLRYTSNEIKGEDPVKGDALVQELYELLLNTKAETVYSHNPFDKHETHMAVMRATVCALKKLPEEARPKNFYGCEVWRGLDWLPAEDKINLDVSKFTDLQKTLIGCHESQIAGGKNYIAATIGREFSNATYLEYDALDKATAVTYAVDMMPLISSEQDLTIEAFVQSHLKRFNKKILETAHIYS